MKLTQNISMIFTLVVWLCAVNFSGAQMTISGTVHSPWGAPMPGALIDITDGSQTHTVTTNAAGEYALEVPEGNYTVRAYSNNQDYANGVDLVDLFLLRMHFLGTPFLDNPYKVLAADVNLSNMVTVFDSVLITRVIDGTENSFAPSSWRFVDAAFDFPTPTFAGPVPEQVSVSSAQPQANFVGFKVGDLNWDVNLLTGIEGKVFLDATSDCSVDVEDEVGKMWLVKVRRPGESQTLYGMSDQLGNYRLALTPGDYLLSLVAPNENWNVCQTEIPVTVGASNYQLVNLSAFSFYDCPVLTVDVGAPFLRRCFDNQLTIHYVNNGNVMAEDAYVVVDFDAYLEVMNSTLPWSTVSANTYTFPIGDLAPGEQGRFHVTAKVSCDAGPGKTHCVEATIYPDTSCLPANSLWDGSDLGITSQCDGDTLRFFIENQGEDMQQPSPYYVVVDDMIMMNGTVELPSGGTKEVKRPADGATLRLIVEQTPGHPGLSTPTRAVEGCGVNENGGFSTGFVTQFPEDEADFNVSVYCAENVGAYDPNDKQAFPRGVGEPHYIEPGQELEYLIRFQNTGTDTAFTVVIRDTLSEALDPATLQPGVSSHPCTWQLRGDGILALTFGDIQLPDSTINEPASHGFAAFRIRQKEGLALPTVITNEAAIYFDFNDPVITNQVTHTVDVDFLQITTATNEHTAEAPVLHIYPNPLKAGQPFQVGNALSGDGWLVFYNATGKPVAMMPARGGKTAIVPAEMPAGWYRLEWRSENKVIGRGSVIVAR